MLPRPAGERHIRAKRSDEMDQRSASETTMKRTSVTSHVADLGDELREEYRFDYAKVKPNRFAGQSDEPRVVVVLDPDVADVFETPDSVNEVLRALIKAMPKPRRASPRERRARTGA